MATKRTVSLVIEYKNGKLVTRELNETADAVDRTSKAAERTEKSLLAAKAAAAAVGAALFAAAKFALDEWIKAELAITQMEASLRSLGRYTPQVSQRFQELASALQKTSRYGDDELLPMFSKLISLGNVTENQMERVMRAAMDFAVVTGSLESAVDLLAKASVGYTATLSRYGIILDETIPKGEKFEAVLQLIESRMGGMEAQMAQTTGGAIAQMKNAIGDLAEEFGKVLAPSINVATRALTNFIVELQAVNKGQEQGFLAKLFSGGYLGIEKIAELSTRMERVEGMGPDGRSMSYWRLRSAENAAFKGPRGMNAPNPAPPGGFDPNQAYDLNGNIIYSPTRGSGISIPRIGTIPRPVGGDMGLPNVNIPTAKNPFLSQLDMSNPPGAGVGDRTSNRMAFFENEWAKAFDGTNQGMMQMAGIAQSSAGIIGSAFAGAFAGMASGAQSAGDAILGAMLGALGTIATMWGSFLVSVGLGMTFVPGMQQGAAAVGYGAALLALGGTLQGLAASMGSSSNTGGTGISAGRSTGGAAIGVGAGGGSMGGGGQTIIVISADGTTRSGGSDIGRVLGSAGVSRSQFRTVNRIVEESKRTSGSY